MKKIQCLLVISGFVFSGNLLSESMANVTKDTPLFKMPTTQSEKLKKLKKAQQVNVFTRKGGWYQVSADSLDGWVRMFYLRFSPQTDQSGRLGVGALLTSTNKPHSDITLTTGVRGITEKQLKNSKPDFATLSKMYVNASNARQAESFAKDKGLKSRKVKYAKVKE